MSSFITKELAGCKYPATDFVIRHTAADGSYEYEHHIYLIPEGSNYAYDLCLDTAWGNEREYAVAKSFEMNKECL